MLCFAVLDQLDTAILINQKLKLVGNLLYKETVLLGGGTSTGPTPPASMPEARGDIGEEDDVSSEAG